MHIDKLNDNKVKNIDKHDRYDELLRIRNSIPEYRRGAVSYGITFNFNKDVIHINNGEYDESSGKIKE
jgi:hypothetical protein